VEAVLTKKFRPILSTLRLFNHVTDWKKLYRLATRADCWQRVGALYDVARLHTRVRRMPLRYRNGPFPNKQYLVQEYSTKIDKHLPLEERWNVGIPFAYGDLAKTAL
jgi:hypothetical protein